MPEMPELSGWMMTTGGGALLIVVYKYFWPAIRESLSGQSSQWRSENRYITQLELARDKAVQGEKAANDRADAYFQELTGIKAEMQIMQHKLDLLQEQNERLTAKLARFVEDRNA